MQTGKPNRKQNSGLTCDSSDPRLRVGGVSKEFLREMTRYKMIKNTWHGQPVTNLVKTS